MAAMPCSKSSVESSLWRCWCRARSCCCMSAPQLARCCGCWAAARGASCMAASYTRAASQWLCRAQGVCCTKRCAVSKSRAASRLISFASGAKACRRCAQLLVVSNRGNKLQGQRCAHCLRAKGTSWAKGSSTTLWVGSAWVCCRCCAMRVRMACHCIGGLLRRLAWGLVGRFFCILLAILCSFVPS